MILLPAIVISIQNCVNHPPLILVINAKYISPTYLNQKKNVKGEMWQESTISLNAALTHTEFSLSMYPFVALALANQQQAESQVGNPQAILVVYKHLHQHTLVSSHTVHSTAQYIITVHYMTITIHIIVSEHR